MGLQTGGVDAQARIVELEDQLAAVMAAWTAEREELLTRVRELEGKVADLEQRLGKNSSNSSMPPSSDSGSVRSARVENANRKARRRLGRSQGKQRGAPGHTLSQVTDPDVVVVHRPQRCRRCDAQLTDAEVITETVRQVFDVPDPQVVVTEHRAQRLRCECGWETTGQFPPEATAPACYGPSIKAHAIYLLCAQHVPRERCAQSLADLFGLAVSTGTLDNWLSQASVGLGVFSATVADQLAAAPVIHADETSVRSAKTALWVHVCSTAALTLLWVGRRDRATIEAGPLGDYRGAVCHDRLAAYFNYGTRHLLCNAHILRSLNEIVPNHRHRDWAQGFIELICDTKNRADAAREAGRTELTGYRRNKIRRQWDQLCDQAARAAPAPVRGTHLYGTNKTAHNLAVALTTHRDLFLAYTRDLTLPFDNNQAERDLRMIKLQNKISGEFRSPGGAARFATIRSYISTNRKQHQPLHRHLRQLFTPTGAWLPNLTT